ncbi:MAG: hypothetical protein E8D46_13855, partial [Nitrospira sp.]
GVGDTVVEGLAEGTDTVQSALTYTLGANVENLTLTGAAAINGTGNALNNLLTGNSAANLLTGGLGNDTYVVGVGDTVVEGLAEGFDTVQSALTYTLGANLENLTLTGALAITGTGNALNNVLTGNSAANLLIGGLGNDTYVVGADDIVAENLGEGTDTVQSALTYTLGANVENLTLTGALAIDGTGNALNNSLTGNSAANVLIGGLGNDTLTGNAGDDTLNGDAGNDVLTGGAGNDILDGWDGNDVLNGGIGDDYYVFYPFEGQDTIQDADATVGNQDRLFCGADSLNLVLSRQVNDLRIAVHGTSDHVIISNWYGGANNQVETIEAGNGQMLLSTQVDQLIQAMAGFTAQTGLTWDQAIDQQPLQVQTVLAASWQ